MLSPTPAPAPIPASQFVDPFGGQQPRPEHPRPQFERAESEWLNLNGVWQFEIDAGDTGLSRKLHQSELYQRITDVMMEIAGENAGLLGPMEGNRELHPGGA